MENMLEAKEEKKFSNAHWELNIYEKLTISFFLFLKATKTNG
jgi:hypothetical protein